MLQDGSPHLPGPAGHQPDPVPAQSPASDTSIQQAVVSLPLIPAPSAAVAAQDISHASEAGRAIYPAARIAAAERADSDASQSITDGTVVVTLLSLDTESQNRQER